MFFPAVVSLIMLFGASAYAATNSLTGLRHVKVNIAITEDAEELCSVKRDAIEKGLLLPIQAYTRVQEETGQGNKPFIFLDITSVGGPHVCASHIRLRIVQFMSVKLPYQNDPHFGIVELYSGGHVALHPAKDARHVTEAVENMAKEFAFAWQKANPN